MKSEQKSALINGLKNITESIKLTPVVNKEPHDNDWQQGIKREIIIQKIKSGKATGYGIITGELSNGIVAVDCDGEPAHKLAEEFGGLPNTVSFTSGKPGRAEYLYKIPQQYWSAISTKKLKTGAQENGKEILLELRWDGCQSVLPPSKHPETGSYKWINDLNTLIAEAPTWVIEQMLDVQKSQSNTLPLTYETNTNSPEPIPLIQCLSRDHREMIERGISQGGRNDGGAAVARDLIGTETRLNYLGISYLGTARQLFDEYCDRCAPAIQNNERETIWKSAVKDNPTACLDDDKLENCWKAWQRKQRHQTSSNTSKPVGNPTVKTINSESKKKASEDEILKALEEVEEILLDFSIDEIHKEIKINQIKEDLGIDYKLWDKLRSTINKKIRSNQLELELKSLLLIDDKIKLIQAIQDLSEKYRINIYSLKELLKELKSRNTTPQFESIGLDDFFDEISDTIDYLVPGLLPKGESVVLAASPKVGKSLLATDLAFAVATGDDYFLGEKCQVGKVLLVSVDESKQSLKKKLDKRGFRKSDAHNLKIVPQFCVSQLHKLEEEIESFRPVLVIIDSLKRITKGSEISENSAEFADNIYTISELCNKYGASCVLIHHTNKNSESTGVENVRGSSAIAGALGNVWLMNRVASPDPNNKKKMIFDPKDPRRQILCYSRDSEGKAFNLEFNPENNSWSVVGQVGISDEEAERQKTAKERILSIMRFNMTLHPDGLSGQFIFDCLELEEPGGMSKSSMYVNLNRLVDDKILGSKPATDGKRYSLYFLHGYGQSKPQPHTTNDPESTPQPDNTQDGDFENIPPLPPLYVPDVTTNAQTIMDKEIDVSYNTQKLSYKSVTLDIEKTPPVTSCNPDTEVDTVELVTKLQEEGGGGFPLKNVTNLDEAKERTTKPEDTTKPLKFDDLKKGDVVFDTQGNPHQITKRNGQLWQSSRGDYISREDILTGVYRGECIHDLEKMIISAVTEKNLLKIQWLNKKYSGGPESLMSQAINQLDESIALNFYEFLDALCPF